MNEWMQRLGRGLGRRVDSELEAAVCAHLGVTRLDRQALEGRLTLIHGFDDHDVYAVDGVPVLRLGPVELTQGEGAKANVWTVNRTMQRLSKADKP